MSALPSKADIHRRERYVRFVPKADFLRCSEERPYSITSSATARSCGGKYQAGGQIDRFAYWQIFTL
jgi:hypothetical protein